jgi:glutathione peroxidase
MRARLASIVFMLASWVFASQSQACALLEGLDFRMLASDERVNLCEKYHGKVLLIVNTASKCAFTPQYEGLEALYRKYNERGLVVLGFPSDDFGGQEPGAEGEIKRFCRLTYSVNFPMFEKTHAREDRAGTLYQRLGKQSGEFPRWNFHKYLLDREGNLVGSYSSFTKPQSDRLVEKIQSLL